MKNILIISASPRKGGNSELLCEAFLKGALEAGHKGEIVRLHEHELHPCMGCEACQATHACVQKDGMAPLLEKLLAADVAVMATPVYFYSMSAQMKMFIDRTLPRYTDLSGKEFYFIAAAADSNKSALERTIDGFRGFTDCLEKAQEKGVLLAPGVWKKGDIAGSPAMEQAFAMGRNA
ncbi:flavodoxin family protein [Mailhella massiliensis]|uniref:Flavodoxin family protein n=1 Tax=Mailhella massiliensis TaxID=1903261 RepID=A0A921AYN1_9BACT|nr:flavodoxin family protein [Mailhella massiliensis]HJD98296.1 flavodoxin family protein [Mailhella massiliensis]